MTDRVRIDYNELGVDDVAVSDVSMFRMERMNNSTFWIRLYMDDGRDIVFDIGATNKSDKLLIRASHYIDVDDERKAKPVNLDVDELANNLWATLDTEINPPGILDHTVMVPLIKRWLLENIAKNGEHS